MHIAINQSRGQKRYCIYLWGTVSITNSNSYSYSISHCELLAKIHYCHLSLGDLISFFGKNWAVDNSVWGSMLHAHIKQCMSYVYLLTSLLRLYFSWWSSVSTGLKIQTCLSLWIAHFAIVPPMHCCNIWLLNKFKGDCGWFICITGVCVLFQTTWQQCSQWGIKTAFSIWLVEKEREEKTKN